MTASAFEVILGEVEAFLEPLALAAEDTDAGASQRDALFRALGLELTDAQLQQVGTELDTFLEKYDALVDQLEGDPFENEQETIETLVAALKEVKELFDAVVAVENALSGAEFDTVVRDLLDYLALTYLQSRRPAVYHGGVLLSMIDVTVPDTPEGRRATQVGTLPYVSAEYADLDFERIPELLSDPIPVLRDHYLPSGPVTDEDVRQVEQRVLPWLGALAGRLGCRIATSDTPLSLPDGPGGPRVASKSLAIIKDLGDGVSLSLRFAIVRTSRGLGVAVFPTGDAAVDRSLDEWALVFSLSGELDAFVLTAEGVEPLDSGDGTPLDRLAAAASLKKLPEEGTDASFVLGPRDGTHVEIGEFGVESEVTATDRDVDVDVMAAARRSAFVLAAGEADGFLQQVLPEDDLRAGFDLGLGWSTGRGVYLEGAAGLEATFPIHESIGDVLRVESVSLEARAAIGGAEIPVEVTTTAGVTLGPLDAVVENVGLRATVSFPENRRGNLGPLHVELGFRPPSGAGLSIDAAAVTGGGYLFFDPDRGQYAGTLQLGFENLVLNAVGILTTRMPDGSEGFSLLLIITGEFPPVQLGYGFTLNGVGGLLGVNRTAALEPLRSGIRAGRLGSVLFPRDPIRNAPQIISDLNTLFPPAAGRFIVGPMAKLGWGTPTLLTAELGIALELPAPIRLVIMGRLSTVLPAEEAELIRLRMDALGTIDFDRGDASIDASLFDSRFVQFTASGDMAMRANWGADPNFALSAGGFNPRFQPPENFPSLRRLTISLATGDNPRLRLETYLAVTSNTFQVGAKLELYASAAGFSIEGVLGFDTLFQFSPFAFVADLQAGVAVKRGSRELFSIRLELTLSGPKPWHARGKAKFKLLFFSVSIPVNVRIGSDDQPPLPEGDPLGELRAALSDPRNWSGQVPASGRTLVSLRERPDEPSPDADGAVLVHPLSSLTVRQRVVPLGVEIQKFGNTRPRADRLFEIGGARLRGQSLPTTPVTEKFAPANFFEYTDEEKLTRPSFEDLTAGVTVGRPGVAHGDGVTTTLDYETEVIDDQRDPDAGLKLDYTLPFERFAALDGLTAVAGSPMRTTGRLTFAAPAMTIALRETQYAVATTGSLAVQADVAAATSYAVARTELRGTLLTDPSAARDLQVVSEHAVTMEEP